MSSCLCNDQLAACLALSARPVSVSQSDPRLIVMALNNRDLAYVTWEERVQAGDPKWEASSALPDVPYADFAKLIGLAPCTPTPPAPAGTAPAGVEPEA